MEREHEANLLQALLHNIPDPIYFKDRDHRFVAVSRAKAKHWHTTPEDLIGKTDFDFLDEAEAEQAHTDERQVMETGQPMAGKEEVISYPDGSERWYPVTKSPYYDAEGEILGIVGISRDITDTKLAEARLRDAEEKYRGLCENLQDAIVQVSSEGVLRYVSPAIQRLTGHDPEALLGRPATDFVVEENRADVARALKEAAEGEPTQDMEVEVLAADGRHLPVEVTTFPIVEEGEIVAFQCVLRDITERKRLEQELTGSAQQWRNTFDAIEDMVTIIDSDYRVVQANTAVKNAFPDAEVVGAHCYELFHGCDAPPAECPSCEAFLTGEPVHAELCEKHLGGRWFDLRAYPILSADGTVDTLVHILRDISGRKRGQERFAHLNQVLQAIRNVNQLITRETDRDRLLQSACEALTDTRGYYSVWIALFDEDRRFAVGFESGLGNSFTPLREALQRGELAQCMRDVLGKSEVITVEHTTVTCGDCPLAEVYPQQAAMAMRLERAGKVYGLVNASLPAEMADSEEEQSLFAELSADISFALEALAVEAERKRAEEAVREERDKAQNYLDIAGTMLAVVDADEKVSMVNNKGCEILGYSEEEIIGQNWFDILVPERHREEVRGVFRQLMAGEVEPVEYYENPLLNKNGEERSIAFHNTVLRDEDGNIYAVLLSGEDITERKRAEEALRQAQKMEAVGTLAAGIAHDFNNMLQTLTVRAQLMLMTGDFEAETVTNLREMISTGSRGASLVQRLLVFSRRIEPRKQIIHLEKPIEDVRLILARTISKLITIETDVQEGLWHVGADPYQMEQVLLNMGINSAEAMPGGGVLKMAAENLTLDQQDAELSAGRYVVLSVSDTGTGIDEEDIEHILEPFYTSKGHAEHSGLGLAIVDGIVESHDGFLRVSSEPGMGTTCKVYLLVADLVGPVEEVRKEPPVTRGPLTVLVVDDEPAVARLLCDVLENSGHHTLKALDGEEGLEVFRAHHEEIDVVLLDLIMPKLEGERCLEEMLAIDPEVVVVIATGYFIDDATRERLEPKIKGFLTKPFEVWDIIYAVHRVAHEDGRPS